MFLSNLLLGSPLGARCNASEPFYLHNSSDDLAIFAAIHRAALLKSYRDASFRVVPRALWHAPCVMTSLTGLLESQTATDNESDHHNDCK
jgi:hypothetical protein